MNRGIIGIWLLLILWSSLLHCYYSLRQKKYIRLLLPLTVAVSSYFLLQSVMGDYGIRLSDSIMVFICSFCSLIVIFGNLLEYRWKQTHLSEMSVKHAVDALPTGICCYDTDGRVLLKNKIMEEIHWNLTGRALLNGISFENQIYTGENTQKISMDTRFIETEGNIVVIFLNHKVYEFCKEELEDHETKKRKYVLTASEITEEYQKTQTLLEKQKMVTELNQRFREYNKEILSVITAREILNAKIKIHDELGASLLRVKKYLKNRQDMDNSIGDEKQEQERLAILDSLRQNMTFLQRELNSGEADEYALLLKTAQQLDVRIEIEGKLPKEENIRNICVTALHECLTNTLRHAKGNSLSVSFLEDEHGIQAFYTNNGIAPSEEIVEKGGLKTLRNLVEQEGGSMEIRIKEGFLLILTFGKEENQYGI